ncbi:glycosyltransferase family 39 protein [bacterium]|nr:glycosyltransferase family 39 protein [bacterium]
MIWDDWILTGRIISALAMVGSLYFIFRMTQWTGIVLLLISPIFLHCAYHLTGDALAWFFMCGAYWVWHAYKMSIHRKDWVLFIGGVLAGLAFCTRYQMIFIYGLGLFLPFKKSWRFWSTALGLAIFQIILNLRHDLSALGNNIFNISEKGTALNVGKIAENLIVFPMRIMLEAWPLFGILFVLAVYELVKRRRYELLILTFGTLCMVCVSFYSFRFFLPMMLPVVIGASNWIGRNLEVTIDDIVDTIPSGRNWLETPVVEGAGEKDKKRRQVWQSFKENQKKGD